MRLSPRLSVPSMPSMSSMLIVFGLVAPLAPLAGGCAGGGPREPMPSWQREDVETLTMKPEWQRFARDNALGVVLAQVNAPRGTKMVEPPKVVATRNRTRGTVELLATGEVDVPDVIGKPYRRPYSVLWEQSGGGWRVADVQVATGLEVPPPTAVPSATPAARPTTRPVTPTPADAAPAGVTPTP